MCEYEEGDGRRRDRREAHPWFRRADAPEGESQSAGGERVRDRILQKCLEDVLPLYVGVARIAMDRCVVQRAQDGHRDHPERIPRVEKHPIREERGHSAAGVRAEPRELAANREATDARDREGQPERGQGVNGLLRAQEGSAREDASEERWRRALPSQGDERGANCESDGDGVRTDPERSFHEVREREQYGQGEPGLETAASEPARDPERRGRREKGEESPLHAREMQQVDRMVGQAMGDLEDVNVEDRLDRIETVVEAHRDVEGNGRLPVLVHEITGIPGENRQEENPDGEDRSEDGEGETPNPVRAQSRSHGQRLQGHAEDDNRKPRAP